MHRLLFVSLIGCLLLSLWPFGVARAAEVSVTPVVDTTVKRSEPDTSFGTSPSLDALYDSGTDPLNRPVDVHEALIKFDLSSIPANMYIQSATLKLTGYGSSVYGYGDIRLRRVTAGWDDTTTWNTRPTYTSESVANLEVLSNSFPPSIDVTSIVRQWYDDTATNYGLAMRAFGDGDYQSGLFTADDAHASSKEGPNPPQLTIVYTQPTPTPSPSSSGGGNGGSGGGNGVTEGEDGNGTPSPGTSPPPGSGGSGGGSGGNGSGGDEGGSGELQPIVQQLDACEGEIRDLAVGVLHDRAEVTYTTRQDSIGTVYYYIESKVTPAGASGVKAANVQESSVAKGETNATRQHRIILSPLEAKQTYYFTLFNNGTQECEQTFATLTSAEAQQGPSVISGSSQGVDFSETPSGMAALTEALGILGRGFGSIFRVINNGQPVSVLTYLSLLTLIGVALSLGLATSKVITRWYTRLRNLPNLWYGLVNQKKRSGTWGRAISAVSMTPLSRVRLCLIEAQSGTVVEQTVTDERGLFGFLAAPGTYRIQALHGGYVFPSVLMPFGYQGGTFTVDNSNGVVHMDIPMDPAELKDTALQRLEAFMLNLVVLRLPILALGSLAIIGALVSTPSVLNGLIFLFLGWLWWQEYQHWPEGHFLLTLTSSSGSPRAYTLIRLETSRGRLFLRKVTNKDGQLYVVAPAGAYTLEVLELAGSSQIQAKRFHQEITLSRNLSFTPLKVQI